MQELDKWLSTAVEASDREMEEKESKLSAALSEPLEGATQDSTVQSYRLPAQSKNEITQLVKGFCKDSLTGKQVGIALLVLLLVNLFVFSREIRRCPNSYHFVLSLKTVRLC